MQDTRQAAGRQLRQIRGGAPQAEGWAERDCLALAGAVVLLGDSIKTVKPYFGQGANSALEELQQK
eukprot:3147844-Amphidinium_carterae.1